MKFSYAFVAPALPFLAATSLAAPTSNYVVHEPRDFLPSGWVKSLKIDGRQRIPMRFGLKQSNIENMDDILMNVADPTSPN
jgi:tripeptidyl-peptidase I